MGRGIMAFEKKITVNERIDNLHNLVKTVGLIQQEIVNFLDDKNLENTVMATILSLESNRNSFTEWISTQDNVPDDVMTFMMDINESIRVKYRINNCW